MVCELQDRAMHLKNLAVSITVSACGEVDTASELQDDGETGLSEAGSPFRSGFRMIV